MIFPTLQFAAFFAVVLPLSWLLMPHPRLWKPFIIAASYFFYGSANPHYVFLLVGCTIWNQVMAIAIDRHCRSERSRSIVLFIALAGDLGLLGWFKYYGFFVDSVAAFTSRLGLPLPLPLLQVALPIGISFFTFQAMSYIIDVRRGQYEPATFLDFAVYLSFFPHLIAGPIVRARELIGQFATPRNPRRIEAARAFGLICGGLLKKVVIADYLATRLIDPVFGAPVLHSRWDVIAAIYGYAVQIYCDFSAYSDMAIGLALLLGFQFPPNFDRPYLALSIQEFWHRWHMTLSRWLRDYLYIGLGGNRKGRVRTYVNLMLTMLLGGLWHGAAWNFVLWGGMHGLGLAWERWWGNHHGGRRQRPKHPVLSWFVTFQFVCFAWILFRADTMQTFGELWHQLVFGGGQTTVTLAEVIVILVGLGIQFIPRDLFAGWRIRFAEMGPVLQGVALSVVLIITSAFVSGQGVAPFIYYRF
ncbi:MAG: MBOAT family protein [Chloroflexi bacterium]|nr:MBOAT family protein [Chloroflexota bacterium]